MPFKDPEDRRTYLREYRRLQRAGSAITPGATRIPEPMRLKTASDVLALLDEQVQAVRADGGLGTVERARVVGFLGGVALKAIEVGELAARVEAVESVLKSRRTA